MVIFCTPPCCKGILLTLNATEIKGKAMKMMKNKILLVAAVAFFAALNVRASYDPSTGRWFCRDPLGDASFFNSYSRDKDLNTANQLASTALGPAYCFNANNPVSETDLLGLENASIQVTTLIRPPFPQDGVKTKHYVLASDHGNLVSTFNYVGTTQIGPIIDTGVGSFDQGVGGDYPAVTVFMGVTAQSYFLQLTPLKIQYGFEIDLNFCSRKGHLSGWNNRFPSYNVLVNGKQVYDFQQVLFFPGLLGQDPAEPNVDFQF
jgi:hypothetical protein